MNMQPTVSEILHNASRLEAKDLESLLKKIAILRIQRRGIPSVPHEEAKLLIQINKGFPTTKWERLQFLDWKIETSELNEKEVAESLRLAAAYESYTVKRLHLLIKLAELRSMPLNDLMAQLEIRPVTHA